ncbi:uncharacterized protein LOC131878006 [Tigriopus californicus]|uniref:uncharacterized protein LOC131878006 n=1 Tax=Tigriopus californicus TaxID=6832 RepID=UPI0027DAA614|nr:uncharacterized protein LOC131878006 [Tigriopus californicus]
MQQLYILVAAITLARSDEYPTDYIAPPTDLQEYYPQSYPEAYNPYYIDSRTVFSGENGGIGIPVVAALGVGGLAVGLAIVQHSALKRERIRSQVSTDQTIAAALTSLTTSQTSSLASLVTAQAPVTARVDQVCSAFTAASAAIPDPVPSTVPTVAPVVAAFLAALQNNLCV